jgi:hypothetical protein
VFVRRTSRTSCLKKRSRLVWSGLFKAMLLEPGNLSTSLEPKLPVRLLKGVTGNRLSSEPVNTERVELR